jgi:hypothetical protein
MDVLQEDFDDVDLSDPEFLSNQRIPMYLLCDARDRVGIVLAVGRRPVAWHQLHPKGPLDIRCIPVFIKRENAAGLLQRNHPERTYHNPHQAFTLRYCSRS